MSNPTTLQELAASLAASAEMAGARAENARPGTASMYEAGYRQALLDARATVLAMITADALKACTGAVEVTVTDTHVRGEVETAETCDVVEGCTNEVVDCLGGEFYTCAQHEEQAGDAYHTWRSI